MRPEYENDCPDYLKSYLKYVHAVRNHTVRTQEAYYTDLRVFLRYLKIIHKDVPADMLFEEITIVDVPIDYISEFTLSDAYEYMNYLSTDRRNSSKTRSRKTSSLRRFYDYLYRKVSLIKDNPLEHLEHPKQTKSLPKFLELTQTETLLNSIDGDNKIRDYCIITLFLNCGMRLSELAGINLTDYSKSSRTIRVFGKGQKERIIYINDACIAAIDDYLAIRPKSLVDDKAMFLSSHLKNHPRLSTRRIQKIVEQQLQIAGLGNLGISVHKLRHTCATLMYEYGNVDMLVLKDILGHVSVATTEIYTHLSDKDRKAAAENSPLSKQRIDKQADTEDVGSDSTPNESNDNNQ